MGIHKVKNPLRCYSLGILVGIFLFGSIYSLQVILNGLVIGSNFTAELDVLRRGYKMAFISILLFPVLEELLFRKSILQGLTYSNTNKKSIFLSSILFAVAHIFTSTGLLTAALVGLCLGYLYVYFGGFIQVIIVHVIYNSLIFFLVPRINSLLYGMELNKIYAYFLPSIIISLFALAGCIYLLNSIKINGR